MNDFIKAITNKKIQAYRAYMDIGNNKVGITAWYTKEVLNMVIEEAKKEGHTLLKIEKERR